jgi:hypothetical protein
MEFMKSQTLRLPLASLPEEDKGGYYTSSTLPNSSNSPLKGSPTQKDSPEANFHKTSLSHLKRSPKINRFSLNKSKSKFE